MKKLIALLTVTVMLACSMAVFGSAEESVFLSEQTIPYAVTPPHSRR